MPVDNVNDRPFGWLPSGWDMSNWVAVFHRSPNELSQPITGFISVPVLKCRLSIPAVRCRDCV